MYSKIHSRLDWFFGYIGEPEEDFVVELYGDVNFDGYLNVNDVVLVVNFVLNTGENLAFNPVSLSISIFGRAKLYSLGVLTPPAAAVPYLRPEEKVEPTPVFLPPERRFVDLDFFSQKYCCYLNNQVRVTLKG